MRVDGYVRVSKVRGRQGDSFISPQVQRERIEGWCELHGHELAIVHEELDESGGRSDRPKLIEAIERVERGDSGGVVVAKLDRFGRSLIDGLAALERIRGAGGTFASVADGFDLSTDTGRLMLKFMLAWGEFELDRYREQFASARERAVARGVHPCPVPPAGYVRREDGGLTLDPVAGEAVSELFERAAGGEGWSDLARWLEGRGIKTAYGNDHWDGRAVKALCRNRVYLGEAYHGEFSRSAAHEALTDEVTWRRAQRPGRLNAPRGNEPALLTGLIRCAGCRHVMQPEWRTGCHRYKCRKKYPGGICPAPAYVSDSNGALHVYVRDQFFAAVGALSLEASADEDGTLRELERAFEDARDAYEVWRDLEASDLVRLGAAEYATALANRREALHEAEEALMAERERRAEPLPMAPIELREAWPDLSVLERRELLALAFDAVFIARVEAGRRKSTPIADRIYICQRGEAPADIPSRQRSGAAAVPVRPFVPASTRRKNGSCAVTRSSPAGPPREPSSTPPARTREGPR